MLPDSNTLQASRHWQREQRGPGQFMRRLSETKGRCPFIWKQASVRRTPKGALKKVSLLALYSQTHQKGFRITSGIQLGKAVNNQAGRHIHHTHTQAQLAQQQQRQQLIAWGFRLSYPCRSFHRLRQAALLERLINPPPPPTPPQPGHKKILSMWKRPPLANTSEEQNVRHKLDHANYSIY